jgi:hypothetical protein
VDAIIGHLQSPQFPGEVTSLALNGVSAGSRHSIRYLVTIEIETGPKRKVYRSVIVGPGGDWEDAEPRGDVDHLRNVAFAAAASAPSGPADPIEDVIRQGVDQVEIDARVSIEGARAAYARLAGLCVLP